MIRKRKNFLIYKTKRYLIFLFCSKLIFSQSVSYYSKSVNPGKSDETGFQLWMMENNMQDTLSDADKDGLTALTEYAIGTDPKKVSPESGFEIRVNELEIEELVQEFLIVDITRRVGADDLNFKIQMAQRLNEWVDLIIPTQIIKSINNGNGTETVSYVIGALNQIGTEMYFRQVLTLD